eukprot:TRINITY_DN65588_c0_g1_i1.p1 TRINITY_DN65588_c0_g1~~TRINITY_DN65588_c0_g1_i1.p1  ORF type:complete len:498 (-),score=67.58 TRINITY_DN65588_c0_g1_i1:317-1810(-)
MPSAFLCPESEWHRVLSFLSVVDVARACLALLANDVARTHIGCSWDAQRILSSVWPANLHGADQFLPAAFVTFSASSFCRDFLRPADRESFVHNLQKPDAQSEPEMGAVASDIRRHAQGLPAPRKIALGTTLPPYSLALSGGERFWEGLLAIAMEREIKLVRRYNMKSCGTIQLRDKREAIKMALSRQGDILAVQPSYNGSPARDVHFYSTADTKAPPVTCTVPPLPGCAGLRALDMMPSPGSDDVSAVCASDGGVFHLSASQGSVLSSWNLDSTLGLVSTCKACSPSEVVVMQGGLLLFDVRTANGLVSFHELPPPQRSCGLNKLMDVAASVDSSAARVPTTYFTSRGSLCSLDWRAPKSRMECCQLPQDFLRCPANPAYALLASQGLICICSSSRVCAVALEPAVCLLGTVSLQGGAPGTPISGAGAWAYSSCGSGGKQEVAVVDIWGSARHGGALAEAQTGQPRKSAKMFRKFEGNSHGQHSRGAGKSSRSGRR